LLEIETAGILFAQSEDLFYLISKLFILLRLVGYFLKNIFS